MASSDSLARAVNHAVTFLTQALVAYAPSTVLKLQMILEANLIAHCAPSWNPREPIKGSGRRCLSLSPDCLPPRTIWTACTASNVQWFDWVRTLGNRELTLFIDPGCVAVRIDGQIHNIWVEDSSPVLPLSKSVQPTSSDHAPFHAKSASSGKTFAQRVLEADVENDDEIFALLNGHGAVPAWINPVVAPFVPSNRSASPLSSVSEHSRCSSRSSNSSSSAFSFSSGDSGSSRSSASATSSTCSSKPHSENKQSRRERARAARVFVDTSKTEVTPYDGGKTTVLTGGVMLGGLAKGPKPTKKATASAAASDSNSWRSVRA